MIIHMETFEDDMEHWAGALGIKVSLRLYHAIKLTNYAYLQDILDLDLHKNPSLGKKTTKEEDFFRNLTKDTILKLYRLYQDDFLIFGYNDTLQHYIDLGM